ncbi:phosphoglycerate mutase-like protein [Abortiporus biennis]|nr:phosphoglycerate mutase-like protein [Abortiporus biennis]
MSAHYSTIQGLFVQEDPNVVPSVVGALPPRFGLLDESPERWHNLCSKLKQLNDRIEEEDGLESHYKLFFLGRHGQGYHNVAEAKYGTEAWDDYWSKLNGDEELTWGPDPLLTPLGQTQGEEARVTWKEELQYGIPVPDRFLSSPLKRALDTWTATFGKDGEGEVVDKEPTYTFEPHFSEEDPLWDPDVRETKSHIAQRARAVLDFAFESRETSMVVSITAHGGFINGFLSAVGRPIYALPTGGVLPVVVKCTRPKSDPHSNSKVSSLEY